MDPATGRFTQEDTDQGNLYDPATLHKYSYANDNPAKPGSVYVEFDVESSRIYQAGKDIWGQIPGPGSLQDRLNIKKGLTPIEDMPNAYNIQIEGEKK